MNQLSPKPSMKSAAEALEHLLSKPQPVSEVETVPTQDALGRVLAVDVISTVDVPPMDNTQMDGYAVRTADISVSGAVLPVSQRRSEEHTSELQSH